MKYYMKTGITGGGNRDAGASEFSNLKTGTLETGMTGGFPFASHEAPSLMTHENLFFI
jgi:hypothetical protein